MTKQPIPKFATEEEAAEFWDTHSLADYIDDTEVVEVSFPRIALKQVCLRLAPGQIERVKAIAEAKSIGYQTLLRMWITERVRAEEAAEV